MKPHPMPTQAPDVVMGDVVGRPDCGPYIPATGQPVAWTLWGTDVDGKPGTLNEQVPTISDIARYEAHVLAEGLVNVMEYEEDY